MRGRLLALRAPARRPGRPRCSRCLRSRTRSRPPCSSRCSSPAGSCCCSPPVGPSTFPRDGPLFERPPPPPPAAVLTPLERALLLLELWERVDGAGDQRRALERVADELARRGEAELARAARALAWSEPAPGTEQTTRFAASARSKIMETTG